ncbi:PREDICTED: interleukin-36 beta [Galeopterus variegatus]|uniref:Interleukin-1 n=1 Tax=Galeopterus variegatus TaxID=482537 RepID=A0ABM0SJC0_GALVR|nr:PREDICTED: interleukin-36 beta [Galeopterus variegatus]
MKANNPLREEHPRSFSIRDSLHMVWVLDGNSLIAVPDSSNIQPVTLDLLPCRDTEFSDEEKGNLVYLGINGRDLCLFCAEIQNWPTLQLKEKNIMDLYLESKAQKPFLFFHNKEGSTSAFQSASYPGWFIASSTAGQPIVLTQERGQTNNTDFYLSPVDQTQPRLWMADSRIENQAVRESHVW